MKYIKIIAFIRSEQLELAEEVFLFEKLINSISNQR